MDFLSENGHLIYQQIEKHCGERFKMMDIDHLEMAMLANSIDLYSKAAKYCLDNGVKFTITTEKGGSYEQICPEYTVMKNEYQNILKHSSKFGLNPGDRAKFFKGLDDKKGKKGFNLDGKMKVA
jgi:phage terminase small subunit